MSEASRCPKCGAQLPDDAPAGLCPKCLVQAGFESEVEPEPSAGGSNPAVEPTLQSHARSAASFVPPSQEELVPLFPQLEILELLGKGGMGAVYKARQRGLDRLVALKILPPEIGHDTAFAERFTREARALARLSHPNIVAVYDFGEAAGLFFIVMEHVDGANLRQTIQAGGLTAQQALAIVPQICEALQFAHDEGIVHRDIKPENILIDKRGRVKIADFGLAKLVGQDARDHFLTATHQVMGTLRYMAPEQMQGSREVDHRADIYSLGVVFYELLTGELPMGKFAPPSRKVQVDVRLDEIVLRALEQEPEQRYQHASEVKTDVESITRSPQAPVAIAEEADSSRLRPAARQSSPGLPDGTYTLIDRTAEVLWLLGAVAIFSGIVFLVLKGGRNFLEFGVSHLGYGLVVIAVGVLLRQRRGRLPVLILLVIFAIAGPSAFTIILTETDWETVKRGGLGTFWAGIPLALWTIWLLFREEVRAAFEAKGVIVPGVPNAAGESHRRIPIAAWIGVVPFIVIYVAASAELQHQADAAIARAVAMSSLCFATVYLSVYTVVALVRRSRRVADPPSLAEPRPWRIAMFFSLLFFFTSLFVVNWAGNPFSGSAAGSTAQLTFRVAGAHVQVTLNGEMLAVTERMVGNEIADGWVTMRLRPGEYEVVTLKNGQPVARSGEVLFPGQRKHVDELAADTIRITGPLALPYGPGSHGPNIADIKAIQGRWTIDSQVKGGEPFTEQQRGQWIEFDNDLMRSDVPETPRSQAFFAESRFAMNPATDPGQIDILIIGARGIYRLERDTLTLCIADTGQLRPTEFVSRAGSAVTLTVCRRARKPEDVAGSTSGTAEVNALTKHVRWRVEPDGLLEQSGSSILENVGDVGVSYPRTFARTPELTLPTEMRIGDIRFEVREHTANGFRIHVNQMSGAPDQSPQLSWRARGEPADPDEEIITQTGTVEPNTGDFEVFYPRAFARPPHLVVPPHERIGDIRFTITQQTATGFKGYVNQFSVPAGETGRLLWRAMGPAASRARSVKGTRANPRNLIDLNGVWDSRWGPVEFTHEAVREGVESLPVSATYYRNAATIEGTVNLATRTFEGTFHETNTGMRGRIRLVVAEDGRTIRGTYGYRDDEPLDTHPWDMTRQKPPAGGTGSASGPAATTE